MDNLNTTKPDHGMTDFDDLPVGTYRIRAIIAEHKLRVSCPNCGRVISGSLRTRVWRLECLHCSHAFLVGIHLISCNPKSRITQGLPADYYVYERPHVKGEPISWAHVIGKGEVGRDNVLRTEGPLDDLPSETGAS